jgi:protein TonB
MPMSPKFGPLTGYAETKPAGRRLTALIAIGLLHAGLIYALAHGLARRMVEEVRPPPLQVSIIEEVKPLPPKKPAAPAPMLRPRPAAPAPAFIPPPEVQIQPPVAAPSITAVTPVPPAETRDGSGSAIPPGGTGTGAAAVSRVRTPPVVRTDSCETPSYPAASLRAGEAGKVSLSFLIDVTGKVLESRVERSSGHARLDEAARNALELCKFSPGTFDSKPERAWARMQYDWKIDLPTGAITWTKLEFSPAHASCRCPCC